MAISDSIDRIETDLNPWAREFVDDPYSLYARLREMGPVVWLSSVGVWGIFRDADVREVVTDWKTFGNAGGGGVSNYYREKPWREPSVIFEVDPPDHTAKRAILTRILSPGALARLRSRLEEQADILAEQVVAQGRFDGVKDLAKPFPLKVVPDAVGLPAEDRENLLRYGAFVRRGRAHNWQQGWSEEDLAEADRIVAWVAKMCNRESLTPNTFGSQIYEAADAGEINEYEANMLVRSFLTAGVETTMHSIGTTLYYLVSDQKQWNSVSADPALVKSAFEETVRFDPPAQIIARNTMDAMEFRGVKLGQYDKVIAFVASANRDPSRWENPDHYDVHRRPTGHLGFGTGIHGCVGQMIARMEAGALLGALARRAATLEFDGTPTRHLVGARGFASIPLRVTMK
jgi:cytochrome P450